jgi:glycosyltransferase involved in cell wall biosynthesis
MSKVSIFHFHNGKEGGVFSVLKNLLKFQQHEKIEHHIIYTINIAETKNFNPPEIQNAVSQNVFYYSLNWNFYFTCKKLAKILPNENAIIIANDWIELGMVSNLGLKNPVIQILHGDYNYYYDLASKHNENIDFMMCVSPVIDKKSRLILNPKKVIDWRFPIKKSSVLNEPQSGIQMAFFVGDLRDSNKNAQLLPKIDALLCEKNIQINWHIAGGKISQTDINELWNDSGRDRVKYYGFLNENQIHDFMSQCNTMILPSFKEGFPVSVVEAMKRGIVPFVSYWDGAVEGLVIEGETGFYAEPSSAVDFANKIEFIFKDKELRNKMSANAKSKADEIFDPVKSVNQFENLTSKLKPRKGMKFKAYGSLLDNELLPNKMVTFLRKLKIHE